MASNLVTMPTPQAIADEALRLAEAAVTELAQFIGRGWTDNDQAEVLLAVPTAKGGGKAARRRETWERHAALNLLLGARCLREPGD